MYGLRGWAMQHHAGQGASFGSATKVTLLRRSDPAGASAALTAVEKAEWRLAARGLALLRNRLDRRGRLGHCTQVFPRALRTEGPGVWSGPRAERWDSGLLAQQLAQRLPCNGTLLLSRALPPAPYESSIRRSN